MKNNHGFSNILIISTVLILGFGGYFIYTYSDFNFLTKQNFENSLESQKNMLETNNLKKAPVNTTELKLYINQKEGYSFSYPSSYKISEVSEFYNTQFIFNENHPKDPFEMAFGISFGIENQVPINELFPESVFTKKLIGNKEVYVGQILPARSANINYFIPFRNKFLSLSIMPIFDPEIDKQFPEGIKVTNELKETTEIIIKTFTILENYDNKK